jgi:hypothetical protein
LRLTLVSAALFAVFALSATAYAGGVSSSLTIQAKDNPPPQRSKFHGKLTSTSQGCQGGQRVKLHYNDHENGYQVIGRDKTEANGKWSIRTGRGHIPPGKYFASNRKKGGCPVLKTSVVKIH